MVLRSLSEKLELQQADQHDKEVFGPLEDLREAIDDYKVRSQPPNPSRC